MFTTYLLAVGFICTIVAHESAAQITCYACSIHPDHTLPKNATQRLCAHFDGSATFQVDCPYSTFCMKKTFEISIQGGRKVYGTVRDCAPQKNSYQIYRNGKWGTEHTVEGSIYRAGCEPANDRSDLKTSSASYCYCPYNLCNVATASSVSTLLLLLTATCALLVNTFQGT